MITILRTAPLTSIQDNGRLGMLRHGLSASGPMDRAGFDAAEVGGGDAIEFTQAGLEFAVDEGPLDAGFAGGNFSIKINGNKQDIWPLRVKLMAGDVVSITPGAWGNYGYARFARSFDVPRILGSVSTSSRAALGGLNGRFLKAGDVLSFTGHSVTSTREVAPRHDDILAPFRVIWGLHADVYSPALRNNFLSQKFKISPRLDRMGVQLDDPRGVFHDATSLSLVSDAIVPGDIQILGDGSPIVLMRDHQPTGGYPRIATIISADLDRFAQIRPGMEIEFSSVTVEHAHQLLRSRV
jgi:biotin-dependent carboxylase-like uncharacterized protein